MQCRKRTFPFAVMAAVTLALALGGYTGAADAKAGVKFPPGKLLHLKQVVERYDANGNAVPQYLELWLTKDAGRCVELDAQGNALSVALDAGRGHIFYDTATLKAVRQEESAVFTVGFKAMQAAYPRQTAANGGEYAGRDCMLYLLENAEDWVKLYVDRSTGYVLLCDAPTFRLKTALIEETALDAALFEAPEGLVFEEGDRE